MQDRKRTCLVHTMSQDHSNLLRSNQDIVYRKVVTTGYAYNVGRRRRHEEKDEWQNLRHQVDEIIRYNIMEAVIRSQDPINRSLPRGGGRLKIDKRAWAPPSNLPGCCRHSCSD